MVEGGGFEPPKAEPADLQSAPFDRSGTPPNTSIYLIQLKIRRLKTGARRGIRTHDLLIHTHYCFRSPTLDTDNGSQIIWGLDFLFTIRFQNA